MIIETKPFVESGRRVWRDDSRCPLVCIQGNRESMIIEVCPYYKGATPEVKIERCLRDEEAI